MKDSSNTKLGWQFWRWLVVWTVLFALFAISLEREAPRGRHFWDYILDPPSHAPGEEVDVRPFAIVVLPLSLAILVGWGIQQKIAERVERKPNKKEKK